MSKRTKQTIVAKEVKILAKSTAEKVGKASLALVAAAARLRELEKSVFSALEQQADDDVLAEIGTQLQISLNMLEKGTRHFDNIAE